MGKVKISKHFYYRKIQSAQIINLKVGYNIYFIVILVVGSLCSFMLFLYYDILKYFIIGIFNNKFFNKFLKQYVHIFDPYKINNP